MNIEKKRIQRERDEKAKELIALLCEYALTMRLSDPEEESLCRKLDAFKNERLLLWDKTEIRRKFRSYFVLRFEADIGPLGLLRVLSAGEIVFLRFEFAHACGRAYRQTYPSSGRINVHQVFVDEDEE